MTCQTINCFYFQHFPLKAIYHYMLWQQSDKVYLQIIFWLIARKKVSIFWVPAKSSSISYGKSDKEENFSDISQLSCIHHIMSTSVEVILQIFLDI